eukprot:gene12658-20542_t
MVARKMNSTLVDVGAQSKLLLAFLAVLIHIDMANAAGESGGDCNGFGALSALYCGKGQYCYDVSTVYFDTPWNECKSCPSGKYQDDSKHNFNPCKSQRTSCGSGQYLGADSTTRSFWEMLEDGSRSKSFKGLVQSQLENAAFFDGFDNDAISVLTKDDVGLGSEGAMKATLASYSPPDVCTNVGAQDSSIDLFAANVKLGGPFAPASDPQDGSNDGSLFAIGNVQYCVSQNDSFVQGCWGNKCPLRMRVYVNERSDHNGANDRYLTWIATATNNNDNEQKELPLKEFLFDAELPEFGSSATAVLNAVGLGSITDFGAMIPLVNKPDKPGLVELLIAPSFSFDDNDDNRMSAGLGRLTLRLGGDGSGGMLTVNILVFSAKPENDYDDGERKWAVSFAIAKAPDANPLKFLDIVLPKTGNGLLTSIVETVPLLDVTTARGMLFFLATAEIGVRITAGQTSIPSAALASSGASLCSGEGPESFCDKHLELEPDYGLSSAANSAKLVASIWKSALPENESKECNMLCYALHRMLPNDDSVMLLEGSFEKSPESTKVDLSFSAANVNLHIIKDVLVISKMDMFMRAEDEKFQFGFAVEAAVRLGNDETLGFLGEIYYQAPAAIGFKLAMKGMKYNLFGWEYLHIGNVHVSGGLAPTPTLISNAGFGADVCLGPQDRCEKCVGARVIEGTTGSGTECAPLALSDAGSGTSQGKCENTIFARAAVMFSQTLEDNYIYIEIRSDITLGSFFRALDYSDVVEKLPEFITETGIVKPEGSDAILLSFAFKPQKIETSCPPVIVEGNVMRIFTGEGRDAQGDPD